MDEMDKEMTEAMIAKKYEEGIIKDIEDAATSFKVKVTRPPVCYVCGQEIEEPPKKEKKPRKRWSRYIDETEEERKARMTKNALDWYEKHKNDPEFMEKRRQYASEYYRKKKALAENV